MSVVRIKTKYQVTLPASIRDQVRLGVGDYLEARVERGRIILTPQALVERGIAEALEDLSKGRVSGPFESAKALTRSLRENSRKLSRRK